jgi:drug/metabolite transporter (DMT)-like permease
MFTFAGIVLHRFWQKRQMHSLFWGLGLLMFGVGAFAEAYLTLAWSDLIFRSWYVFGAMLNAAWLGHGSLVLLARRPWLRYVTFGLITLSLVGVVATFAATLDASGFSTAQAISTQYKAILPPGGVRLFTPLFNIYGTLFLVGGAIYSALLFLRRRTSLNRVAGNVLIAAGALTVASAGTLTRFFGGGALHVSELAAAILMFAGFMLASAPAASNVPISDKSARAV